MKHDGFSRYHPALNFLFFLFAIGCCVVIQHPVYVLISCAAGASYLLALSGRKGLLQLLGLIPIFVLLAVINPLFNTDGSHILFSVFGRPYTQEALLYGMVISGMLVGTLLWFFCYQQVLTSDKFLYLFSRKIPSLALLLTMIFRLVPNFLRKGRQIRDARMALGKGEKTAKEGVLLLSSLTSWALEGSIVTADSMASRGYGCGKPTAFSRYIPESRDYAVLICLLTFGFLFFFFGNITAEFTPVYVCAPLSGTAGIGAAAYGLFCFLPTFIHAKEVLSWRIYKWRI